MENFIFCAVIAKLECIYKLTVSFRYNSTPWALVLIRKEGTLSILGLCACLIICRSVANEFLDLNYIYSEEGLILV